MNKFIINTVLLIIIFSGINLTQTKEEIVAEGKKLFNLERASWLGTDILVESFPDLREKVGGYFSYKDKENYHCIFYSEDNSTILFDAVFSSDFNNSKTVINDEEREMNEIEKALYSLRISAFKEISEDTLFKHYENTSLNLIPILLEKENKVYVLTGSKSGRAVIFGNDYLLTFNKNNEIKEKKSLHQNIIVLEDDKENKAEYSFHNHLESSGDLITATDICTLMLYAEMHNWKQHYVVSDKFVSIWDSTRNLLEVITREEWDKLAEEVQED